MSHALTYDTLPPHSRVRREVVDGVLRLTAMAEEPGPMVRRAALVRSAIPAAGICGGVLLVCLAIFGSLYRANHRGLSYETLAVLMIAFSIFCMALFGFIWRAQYFARVYAAQTALKQATILAASKGRLIVETSGPLGPASHDLRDVISIEETMDGIEIVRSDSSRILVLRGRDAAELRWIARALAEAMGL